jgi:hypothetical protein
MIRCATLSLAAFALSGVPASAATYIGKLNGVITSGEESYYNSFGADIVTYTKDLTGGAISIDFAVDAEENHTDQFGKFLPKYVAATISVNIPSVASGIQTLGSTYSDDEYVYLLTQDIDFVGDDADGHLTVSGYRSPSPAAPQALDVSYAGASAFLAPLTGSGTTVAGLTGGFGHDLYNIDFKLTEGFVQLATPDAESWALMILGFGAIGSAMRRERRRIVAKVMPA